MDLITIKSLLLTVEQYQIMLTETCFNYAFLADELNTADWSNITSWPKQ